MKSMRKVFKKLDENRNIILLILISIFFASFMFSVSTLTFEVKGLNKCLKVFRYCIYTLFIIDFIIDFIKKERKLNLVLTLTFIPAFFTVLFAGNYDILFLWILMCVFSKFEFKQALKFAFYGMIISFITVILLCVFKLIPDWTYLRHDGKVRHSLGFNYPTPLSTIFMFIILIYSYINNFKFPIWKILIEMLATCLIFYYSDSRTGFLLTMIIIVVTLFLNLPFKKLNLDKGMQNKAVKSILMLLPVISCVVFLLCVYFYSKEISFFNKLNDLLSGRLYYSWQGFEEHNVTLFGEKIKWFGWGGFGYKEVENFKYNYIDNSYLNIMFNYGIVNLLLSIIAYVYMIKKSIDKKDYYLIFVIMICLINAMIEPYLIYYNFNLFIFVVAQCFFKKTNKKEIK